MNTPYWLFGYHAVEAALLSGRHLQKLLIASRSARAEKLAKLAKRLGVIVQRVPRNKIDKLAAGQVHNGVAALTSPIKLWDLQEAAEEAEKVLVLDSVQDPRNVGAIIRSAAAFSMDMVVLGGRHSSPITAAVERSSAGTLGMVKICRVSSARSALHSLGDMGFWRFCATKGGVPAWEVELPERWVLVVGAEGKGVKSGTLSEVDELVSIPMAAGVESLNVSSAAAILMYEFSFRKRFISQMRG